MTNRADARRRRSQTDFDSLIRVLLHALAVLFLIPPWHSSSNQVQSDATRLTTAEVEGTVMHAFRAIDELVVIAVTNLGRKISAYSQTGGGATG